MPPSAKRPRTEAPPTAEVAQTAPPNLRAQKKAATSLPASQSSDGHQPNSSNLPPPASGNGTVPARQRQRPTTGGGVSSMLANAGTLETANAELASKLSALTKEQLEDIVMLAAKSDPQARHVIEQVRSNQSAAVVSAQEKKGRQAEQRKHQVKPDFEKVLDRVWSYLNNDKGANWGRSREITEANRVTDQIEKILDQILDRCPADSPVEFRSIGLDSMTIIWHIVIFSPGSYTRRQCLQDSCMWEERYLKMWSRFTPEERSVIAESVFVNRVIEVGKEWSAHCVGEEMFKIVLQELKGAGGGSIDHLFEELRGTRIELA